MLIQIVKVVSFMEMHSAKEMMRINTIGITIV